MCKWLSRQYDKLRGGNQLVQWNGINSRWYVLYNNGQESMTMFYNSAKRYADIFGGQVKHISEKEIKQ